MAVIATASKAVRFKDGYIGAPNEAWLRLVHPDCAQSKPSVAQFLPVGVKDRPAEIILIGDSHAQGLIRAFEEALSKEGRSGAYWVAPATAPALGVHTSEYSEKFGTILPKIAQQTANVVVICASWPVYFNHSKKDQSQQEADQILCNGLTSTVRMLTKAGKRVVLMHCIPRMDRHIPEYMARTLRAGLPLPSHVVTTSDHLKATQNISDMLSNLATSENVIEMNPADWMSEADHLQYHEGGLAFYADSNHLTTIGARRIIPGIFSAAWPK